jgi:hypothetical protein
MNYLAVTNHERHAVRSNGRLYRALGNWHHGCGGILGYHGIGQEKREGRKNAEGGVYGSRGKLRWSTGGLGWSSDGAPVELR